jgi:hypothetical protein
MQQYMIVLAYLGESAYKISHSWADVLHSPFYLESCDFRIDPTKEQYQILCRSWKKCDGDPGSD